MNIIRKCKPKSINFRKNRHSIDTVNIGHIGHGMKTDQKEEEERKGQTKKTRKKNNKRRKNEKEERKGKTMQEEE